MPDAGAVRARGLGKRYPGGVVAVDGLDLDIADGEVYGLLGRNGAGKTTAMRMVTGLVRPTAGTATVFGAPAGHPEAIAATGALIESPTLYPHLSGRDNLRLLARYAGTGDGAVEEVLAEVGLGDRARHRFRSYSLGMKQRLGVAAALLKRPRLLVLDEPANGLDPAGMAELRDLVRAIAAAGRTVLLSSHLLGEVEQVCDRVGIIHRGRLVAEGEVEALRSAAAPTVAVVATPLGLARRTAEALPWVESVTEDPPALRVTAPVDRVGELNAALVRAGVSVTGLRITESTLEQVFLTLTDEPTGATAPEPAPAS